MEVSKALSLIMKKLIKSNDKVLDVGCACGHFYRSLLKRVNKNFFIQDAILIAFFKTSKKSLEKNDNVNFVQGIFLNFHLKIIILIMFFAQMFCCIYQNHNPLKQLLRVTKKTLILRTVVYDVSYKVQLVYNNKWWKYTNVKPISEFDRKGNPMSFSYFNIHSKDYLKSIIKKISPNSKIQFIKDNKFNKKIFLKIKK